MSTIARTLLCISIIVAGCCRPCDELPRTVTNHGGRSKSVTELVPILDADGSPTLLGLAGDILYAAGIESREITTFRAWLYVKDRDVDRARRVLTADQRTRVHVLTGEEMDRLKRGEHPIRRETQTGTGTSPLPG